MTPTVMTTTLSPDALAAKLMKWKPKMSITINDDASILCIAKAIDVDADDLRKLADMLGDQWKITFGRSGGNFRMIIW